MDNPSQTVSMKENATGRIQELDGWRAVAASTVVLAHLLGYQLAHQISGIPKLWHILHFTGNLGVQLLFIISGFVICRLLLIEEHRHGSFSLRWFYIRRVLRVLPPFYLYLATLAVLAKLGMVVLTGRQIAKAALFLVDFHSYSAPWLTGHAWSLSVEEQFYVFFPTVLWLTPPRWRRAVFGAVCALCIAAAITLSCIGRILPITSGVMIGFVGIFYGVLLSFYEEKARLVAKKVPLIVVLLLAAMLLFFPLTDITHWRGTLYLTLVVPPTLALLMLFTMEQKSRFRSFLCWRPVRAIGMTSYALYLWQQLFTAKPDSYRGLGHYIPFFLPALCIIVPLSWNLMEKRSIQLGKNLSRGVRAPQQPPRSTPEQSPAVAAEAPAVASAVQ